VAFFKLVFISVFPADAATHYQIRKSDQSYSLSSFEYQTGDLPTELRY